MLWSSVPQLRWRVAQQVLVTWLALAAMAAIFLLQPTIVRYTHDFLFGQGFVQSDYDQRVFAQYFSYGWWSLAVAWMWRVMRSRTRSASESSIGSRSTSPGLQRVEKRRSTSRT